MSACRGGCRSAPVQTLRSGGVTVEHHEIAGAGHGMYSDDHALTLLRTTIDVLTRHLAPTP